MNYFGSAIVQYTVEDGAGGFDDGVLTIIIDPVNDSPYANPDIAYYNRGTDRHTDIFTPLANDSDVDGDLFEIISIVGANNGTIDRVGGSDNNPSYVYTPNPGFSGTEVITYTIRDTGGLQSTATITIREIPNTNIDDNYIASDDIEIPYVSTNQDVVLPLNINGLQKLQYCATNNLDFWLGLKSSDEGYDHFSYLAWQAQLVINTSDTYLSQASYMIVTDPNFTRITSGYNNIGEYMGYSSRATQKYTIPQNVVVRSAYLKIYNLSSAPGFSPTDMLHLVVFDDDVDATYPNTLYGNNALYDAIGTSNR